MEIFTSADLRKIARNTSINNHSENLVFIAKKINSPTLDGFEDIVREINRKGYLDSESNDAQRALYDELMAELEQKLSTNEYGKVNSRL